MHAISLFEIRNNLIGVFWEFDDAEKDEIIKDINIMKKYHSNDGIYIYSIQNNKIIHKKLCLVLILVFILMLFWIIN